MDGTPVAAVLVSHQSSVVISHTPATSPCLLCTWCKRGFFSGLFSPSKEKNGRAVDQPRASRAIRASDQQSHKIPHSPVDAKGSDSDLDFMMPLIPTPSTVKPVGRPVPFVDQNDSLVRKAFTMITIHKIPTRGVSGELNVAGPSFDISSNITHFRCLAKCPSICLPQILQILNAPPT